MASFFATEWHGRVGSALQATADKRRRLCFMAQAPRAGERSMKRMANELPSVDTNTYRRNSGDLFRGVALAALAAALHSGGALEKLPVLTGAAGVVLYSSALVCSFRTRLLTPVLFGIVLFVTPQEFATVLRLILFSLLLSALSRTSRAIFLSPIVTALWFLSLLLNSIVGSLFDINLFYQQEGVVALLMIELLGAILLQLTLFSPFFTKLFVLPPRSITLRQLVFLYIQLGVLLSLVLLGGFLALFDSSAIHSLEKQLFSAPLIIAYLSLFGLSALVAVWGGGFLSRALKLVAEGALDVPSASLFLQGPVVSEFHRLQRGLLEHFRAVESERDELRATLPLESTNTAPKEHALSSDLREKECLVTLCESAPFGCLAISSTGFIVASTVNCSDFLELDGEKLTGRALSSLTKKSAPCAELSQYVTRFFQSGETKAPIRLFFPSQGGNFLDISLDGAPFSEDESRLGHSSPSQRLLLVYIRRVADARALALSLLSPSLLEIEGVNAQELLRDLREDFTLLERKVGAARKIVEMGGKKQLNIPALLTEVEHFSHLARSDIESAVRGYQLPGNTVLDLGSLIRSGTTFLEESSGFHSPKVEFASSATPTADSKTSPNLALLLNPLSITGEPREVHRFTALLLGVIHHGAAKGARFSCSVAQEEILPETAKLLPGSNAGNYVRLTLTCENLRIGTSVITDDFRSILPTDSSQLELSIIALTIQARRLGGFLSLQYRGAKDSVLTVYVPQLKGKNEAPPRNRKSRFLNEAVASSLPCGVAICSEADLVYDFESPLVTLGFAPLIERKSALGAGEEMVDFGGSGFGEGGEHSTDLLGAFPAAEIRKLLQTNHARLLVLSVNEEPHQVVSFLEKLATTNPELGVVLVVDEEAEHYFDRWVRVIRPFDSEVLVQALEAARSTEEQISP